MQGNGSTLHNPLKPKKLSDQVFERIRDLIFRGDLKPGEQLRSERELSEIMEVSRPTIRQALKRLVERGLVENRQGQGTFVCNPRTAAGENPLEALIDWNETSLKELLEVRMALECQAATSAALRATGEDVNALDQHVQEMRAAIEKGELGILEDVRFHMTLAYASKNQVQILLMKSLYDLLRFGIEESQKQLYLDPNNLETILLQHQNLADAVRRRDPASAYAAMQQHITFLINFHCNEGALLKQVDDAPSRELPESISLTK